MDNRMEGILNKINRLEKEEYILRVVMKGSLVAIGLVFAAIFFGFYLNQIHGVNSNALVTTVIILGWLGIMDIAMYFGLYIWDMGVKEKISWAKTDMNIQKHIANTTA